MCCFNHRFECLNRFWAPHCSSKSPIHTYSHNGIVVEIFQYFIRLGICVYHFLLIIYCILLWFADTMAKNLSRITQDISPHNASAQANNSVFHASLVSLSKDTFSWCFYRAGEPSFHFGSTWCFLFNNFVAYVVLVVFDCSRQKKFGLWLLLYLLPSWNPHLLCWFLLITWKNIKAFFSKILTFLMTKEVKW